MDVSDRVDFGTQRFCELLRRLRLFHITFSQVQVLAMLSLGSACRVELCDACGMSFEGTRKTVEFLMRSGDVRVEEWRVSGGKAVPFFGLTEQGRELISKVMV